MVLGTVGWGGLAGPAIAASDNIRIDVEPEDGYGPVGGTVTLGRGP